MATGQDRLLTAIAGFGKAIIFVGRVREVNGAFGMKVLCLMLTRIIPLLNAVFSWI